MAARADATTPVIHPSIGRVNRVAARLERLTTRPNGATPRVASVAPPIAAMARAIPALTPSPFRTGTLVGPLVSRIIARARFDVPCIAKVSMRSRVPDELLDPAKCSALFLRLTRYAFVCLRHTSWDDAKDVAQGALQRAIDPDYEEWDRAKEPELFRYLAQHAINIIVSEYRRQRRRGLVGESESEEAEEAIENAEAPTQEESFYLRRVREVAADDARVTHLAELYSQGVDSRAEQAHEIGCTIAEITFIRRRLVGIMQKVRSELEKERGARLPASRETDGREGKASAKEQGDD